MKGYFMEFLALEPLNILGLLGVGILSGILAGFFGIGGWSDYCAYDDFVWE